MQTLTSCRIVIPSIITEKEFQGAVGYIGDWMDEHPKELEGVVRHLLVKHHIFITAEEKMVMDSAKYAPPVFIEANKIANGEEEFNALSRTAEFIFMNRAPSLDNRRLIH